MTRGRRGKRNENKKPCEVMRQGGGSETEGREEETTQPPSPLPSKKKKAHAGAHSYRGRVRTAIREKIKFWSYERKEEEVRRAQRDKNTLLRNKRKQDETGADSPRRKRRAHGEGSVQSRLARESAKRKRWRE